MGASSNNRQIGTMRWQVEEYRHRVRRKREKKAGEGMQEVGQKGQRRANSAKKRNETHTAWSAQSWNVVDMMDMSPG